MRTALLLGSAHGFVAVALGAFGAHGLKGWLGELADGAQRMAWWETASHYQLTHAVALLAVAVLAKERRLRVCTWAFALGTLVFSGSLYAMTLSGVRTLGAITPIGGVGMVLGWVALFAAGLNRPAREER